MHPVKMTPTAQRNAVSEGTALGLVMCGRNTLPNTRWLVDLCFEGAWRSWAYRTRFPQVATDIRQGLNGSIAMTRADYRKAVLNLYWDVDGPELVICPRPRWADGLIVAAEAAATIDGGVPASGWRDLAAAFLARLDDKSDDH